MKLILRTSYVGEEAIIEPQTFNDGYPSRIEVCRTLPQVFARFAEIAKPPFEKGKCLAYLYRVNEDVEKAEYINSATLLNQYSIGDATQLELGWYLGPVKGQLLGVFELSDHKEQYPSYNKEGAQPEVYKFRELPKDYHIEPEEIDWLEYYIRALNDNMFTKRKWLFDVFSIKKTYSLEGKWAIRRDDEQNIYYTFGPDGTRYNIPNVPVTLPPVGLWRKVTLYPGDLPNVKEKVVTTTGEMLINAQAYCYKFGDRIPYQSGKIMPKDFHKAFRKLREEGFLTQEIIESATTAIEQLACISDISTPAASRATMTGHPDRQKVRDKFLKEHAGQMQDKVVQAEFDKLMGQLDREQIAGSESETFFIKDSKMHDVVRKKTLGAYGSENDLDGSPTEFIPRSLSEGWDPKQLPAYVNVLRAGSYSRGALTALGGYGMKIKQRLLSVYKVRGVDCKSKEGITFTVNEMHVALFGGRYLVGGTKPLDEAALKALVGKEITLRDPAYCKEKGYGVCEHCIGDKVKHKKDSIALEAANYDATNQAIQMAATHGRALKNEVIDMDTVCS